MGGDYSFWIIVSDVELPFDDSTVNTCLGTNGIEVWRRSCWMNNGCEGGMLLLDLDTSCIVAWIVQTGRNRLALSHILC
jgi:hypothetical protein